MITVYISSPYTIGDKQKNVDKQIFAARVLLETGYCPVIPLLNHYINDEKYGQPIGYEKWMAIDFELLSRCDCLLRLPGESKGADREEAFANKKGIPIYYTYKQLARISEKGIKP